MRLGLRPFEYSSKSDLELMAKWCNDSEIKHLSSIHHCEADYEKALTPEEVAGWGVATKDGDKAEEKWSWMLLLDGEPVGECSMMFGAPHGLHKEPFTAWFGILIGEGRARGRGLGARYFTMLEEESRRLGARQAELGVFAFNARAIRLYEGLGYAKIGEIPEFTWWNGKFWADLRYFKRLGPMGSWLPER